MKRFLLPNQEYLQVSPGLCRRFKVSVKGVPLGAVRPSLFHLEVFIRFPIWIMFGLLWVPGVELAMTAEGMSVFVHSRCREYSEYR